MVKENEKETALRREERVRRHWQQNETFQKSVENREGSPSFVFYEGPPTANGLPHVGHALGRTIKDVVARYKTMTGHQVVRKAGWDTHGLPVELGVEKQLGISGKGDIEKYGVEAFIQKCKESVFVYEKQWREFTESLGYWVDMDDPYLTLSNAYIESEWNILGTIHEKGLLHKGHRVSPYCPSCQTSLSSHEVSQGYKMVKDLSATAKFKIEGRDNEYFLGWTTTPWTLPANVALAVHPSLKYVRAKQGQDIFIVAEALASSVLKEEHEILSVHLGEELKDIPYTPLFDFVKVETGHKVVTADYVSAESGTGIVHIAPAYGEDDYKVVKENGLSFVNVVDEKGKYAPEVIGFGGRFVKDCDVDIVRYLAAKGLLFSKEKYEHSYPHCWRCDSPLLYYANESWFIQTTALKEQFIQNNEQVTWYPDHIKHGRFGNFLEQMVDWNISRKRYWGTPLNVWECEACNHEYAPKSIEDLKLFSLDPLDDIELHKPYVDQVKLWCSNCGGTMIRTPEVIDVWFDSGSMPFAQYHFPFENKELFEKQFPADVVIEGIDQTRGWFYSLLAVSTLFTGKAPYKRVLSTGHILDENGQKMSKSKGNALDPVELIQKYGADALRWSLLVDSAPWNTKRFSERIVQEAKSKLIDTFDNVFSFYSLYTNLDNYSPKAEVKMKKNKLDDWILSRLHSTIKAVRTSLDDYQFTSAAREIANLLEQVSNWYVRRSRERFWSSGMNPEKAAAYKTLNEVLTKTSQLLAPLTPFVAEDVYRNLTGESVHLSNFPKADGQLINEKLEKEMAAVLQVVELGRSVRNSTSLKVKQPLGGLSLMSSNNDINWNLYEDIIKDELNVKQFELIDNEGKFVSTKVKLDFKKAGAKFGKQSNSINAWLQSLSETQVQRFTKVGFIEFERINIALEDVQIEKIVRDGYASASNGVYTVTLNISLTEELLQEGMARELIRAIQAYRKQLNLPIDLRVDITVKADKELQTVFEKYKQMLQQNLLMRHLLIKEDISEGTEIKVAGHTILLQLSSVH
ncbi:isoleucine--tRNA ligase [Psychrobacillus lasiicapitis]|uniref:Isoleucine--tRNA ligase n=1 Tax=Psychrobacillus lasiicapitis TaxID=1636719 RepID=A0A544TH91_9BACI|nr:isoleucine--tRNA ligase [Psychrobacillus lasiicapitis]TQR16760.1 isoleucine--tRNA ligase [Psychrobacillus lasiicapitis]GGA27443.1 isoleucine--tRNA ligase 2 [Psychrobacillus lasiicapitis]